MQLLDKMERRFGKFAINGLMRYVIACYIVGYILYYMQYYGNITTLSYLTLEPFMIFQHLQIWRLVSWLLMPPSNTNIIFVIIMLVLYYQLGTTLERTWGAFRFNLFIIGDVIISIIVALVVYLVGLYGFHTLIYFGSSFSTFYINMSIFLAFAVAFPDMRIMLYFFIPIKMKWMGLVYAVLMVYEFIATRSLAGRVAIVASMATFLIYFFATLKNHGFSFRQRKRRNDFKHQVNAGRAQNAKFRDANSAGRGSGGGFGNNGSRGTGFGNNGSRGNGGFGNNRSRSGGFGRSSSGRGGFGNTGNSGKAGSSGSYGPTNSKNVPIHKCAICGRTELDDPNLTFRYCSKCNGNYEYCQDHLFTHKHIV